jgi:hypothetical protein
LTGAASTTPEPGRIKRGLGVEEIRPFNYSVIERIFSMPKYVIERDIPGAGELSPGQLQAISQKSCGVLKDLGPQIQWVQSYVTGDKIYCVYIAPDENLIREHASQGGFPANKISEVKSIIDPTTAES